MEWKNGEKGPTCFCGMPTAVVVDDEGNCDLLCIFHTSFAGALFPLPKSGRPDKWPEMSDPEMAALVEEGYAEQGEEPGLFKEIAIPTDLDIPIPEGQGNN